MDVDDGMEMCCFWRDIRALLLHEFRLDPKGTPAEQCIQYDGGECSLRPRRRTLVQSLSGR